MVKLATSTRMDERTIFTTALEQRDAEARSRFLDDVCGTDLALRARVEDLLALNSVAGDFLERSPLEPGVTHDFSGTATPQIDDQPRTVVDDSTSAEIRLDFLRPSDAAGMLGRIGPYDVTAVVGRGGMGIVLKALDQKLNRVVAIKALAPELAGNATARRRFLREARAAAAVTHQNVVTIHAVDEDRLPYLVMEFVNGQSLQEKIDRDGPLRLAEILRIGSQVAAGLAAAHAQGLIHRDIKPANILLENGVERVRITDFGLARAVDDVSETKPGDVAGTPQFMSPEQARGEHVDARSDLFNLGCVLYAMCTGRPPFRAESTVAAIHRVCDEAPRSIREVNPEAPGWLVDIIDRLLRKKREERIQTASDAADLLWRHLAHVQDPDSTAFPRSLKHARFDRSQWWRRWPTAVVASLFVLLSLGLLELSGITDLMSTDGRNATADLVTSQESADDPASRSPGESARISSIGTHDPEAAPTAESGAFVVLAGARGERRFETLGEALAHSGSGDTIEVRGDGPFVTEPIVVDHALTIRAAASFRPVILLDPEQDKSVLFLMRASAPLVLEGLEFQRTTPNEEGEWQAIIQSTEQLSLGNCRLLAASHRDCLWSKGVVTLLNSELLVSDPHNMNPFSWDLGIGGRVVVENCVIVGPALSMYKGGPIGARNGSIRLKHSTFVALDGLRMAVMPPPPALEGGQVNAAIEVESSWNVFDLHGSMLRFDQAGATEPFEAATAEALLRRFVDWRDERNVYSSAGSLCEFTLRNAPSGAGKNLGDWTRFWNFSPAGALQGPIRFQGGDLFARAQTEVWRLTPEDFRLHPDSTGYRAGPDGKDLGADIDLVGPGGPYERWQATNDNGQNSGR